MNDSVLIFPGTFDPIHMGHIHMCNAVIKALSIKAVYLIPTFNPPHKKNIITSSFKHRVEMIKLSTPGNFNILDIEQNPEHSGFFYDTFKIINATFENPIFLLGPDSFLTRHYWYKGIEMISNGNFCTVVNTNSDDIQLTAKKYRQLGGNIVLVDSPILSVSSSLIKEDIENYQNFLNPKAYSYIKSNNLYNTESIEYIQLLLGDTNE